MSDNKPFNYEIVKRIIIKEDKVYFVAVDNDIRPLRYMYREEPVLSDIFQKEGLRSLLEMIVRDVYHGRTHLRAGSLITRAIRRGLHTMTLERFQTLEEDIAVRHLAAMAEHVLLDWDHDPAQDMPALEEELLAKTEERT